MGRENLYENDLEQEMMLQEETHFLENGGYEEQWDEEGRGVFIEPASDIPEYPEVPEVPEIIDDLVPVVVEDTAPAVIEDASPAVLDDAADDDPDVVVENTPSRFQTLFSDRRFAIIALVIAAIVVWWLISSGILWAIIKFIFQAVIVLVVLAVIVFWVIDRFF